MRPALRLLVAASIIVDMTGSPRAQCFSGTSSNTSWNATVVKVYVHNTTQSALGQGQGLRYALGGTIPSLQDIEYATMRALQIFNEEVGGNIKLQYGGLRTSPDDVANAIILRSANVGPASDCSNIASGLQNALAFANASHSGATRTSGHIDFFKRHGEPCNPIFWSLTESTGDDYVSVLLHELGHAFYDVGHPDDPAAGCSWTSQLTIMRTSGAPARKRLIKDWDREIFQTRHTPRASSSSVLRGYKNPTGWQTPFSMNFPAIVHYRPGSMGQNVSYRNFGFLSQSGSMQFTGGGTISSARYEGVLNAPAGSSAAMMRPVAVASRPGTSELMIAYVERKNGAYFLDSDVGYICYKFSTNNGATYGTATCQTTWATFRNGLTAAYSARGNVFLIGYVGSSDNISVSMVPASGSALMPFTNVVGFNKSWYAPAVACNNNASDVQGCRVAWVDQTNTGCMTTQAAGVNTSGNSFVVSGSASNSPCFPLFDTPGLAYNSADGTFEALSVWWNDTIYSYKLAATGLTWVFDANVWASPNSFVLTPVLAFRTVPTPRLQAWFIKYH